MHGIFNSSSRVSSHYEMCSSKGFSMSRSDVPVRHLSSARDSVLKVRRSAARRSSQPSWRASRSPRFARSGALMWRFRFFCSAITPDPEQPGFFSNLAVCDCDLAGKTLAGECWPGAPRHPRHPVPPRDAGRDPIRAVRRSWSGRAYSTIAKIARSRCCVDMTSIKVRLTFTSSLQAQC